MGAADVVPGVSGGTMALILGVYQRFIDALSSINLTLVRALFKSRSKADAFRAVRDADLAFLVCLGTGVLLAIASFAKVIPYLIDTYPAHMNALFFGMILASTAVPFKMMKEHNALHVVVFIAMAAFAFWFSGLSAFSTQASLPMLFGVGAIAICAMMLPGVSGSFLLLIMGQYTYVLSSLRDRNIPVILVFGAGCGFGLLAFSRLLSWMLKKFPSGTLAALCGLMFGSLQKVWPYKDTSKAVIVGKKIISAGENVLPWSDAYSGAVAMPAILLAVGIIAVIVLEKVGASRATKA